MRNWLPRWKPWVKNPAIVYLSTSCAICRDLKQHLIKLGISGLEIKDATEYPEREINRISYIQNGNEDRGIAAVARCLEHVNLMFAFMSFLVRMPIITQLLQVIVDRSMLRGEPIKTDSNSCQIK